MMKKQHMHCGFIHPFYFYFNFTSLNSIYIIVRRVFFTLFGPWTKFYFVKKEENIRHDGKLVVKIKCQGGIKKLKFDIILLDK